MSDDQVPKFEPKDELINIKVTDSTHAELWFKVNKRTRMSKIIDTYCKKVGRPREGYRFTYDGGRLNDDDTPDLLGMEENDAIEAYVEQTGGAGMEI